MAPPPWASKYAGQNPPHQQHEQPGAPQPQKVPQTSATPIAQKSSHQPSAPTGKPVPPGAKTAVSQPQPTTISAQVAPQSPQEPSSPAGIKVDYCPQVIPRDALKSGGNDANYTFAPSLEELKQRASGRRQWSEAALRATDALIPLQNGTNRWFSQKGMTGFGTPRDVNGKHVHRLVDDAFPDSVLEFQQQPNCFLQDKSDYI